MCSNLSNCAALLVWTEIKLKTMPRFIDHSVLFTSFIPSPSLHLSAPFFLPHYLCLSLVSLIYCLHLSASPSSYCFLFCRASFIQWNICFYRSRHRKWPKSLRGHSDWTNRGWMALWGVVLPPVLSPRPQRLLTLNGQRNAALKESAPSLRSQIQSQKALLAWKENHCCQSMIINN